MVQFRRSQASISINSCIELNKTQFFPMIFVKVSSKWDKVITKRIKRKNKPLTFLSLC